MQVMGSLLTLSSSGGSLRALKQVKSSPAMTKHPGGGGMTAKAMPWGNKSFAQDKTSGALGALMALPCPPLHTGLLVGP